LEKLDPCPAIGLVIPRDGSCTLALGALLAAVALRIDVCAPPYCEYDCLALSTDFCCAALRPLVMPAEGAVRDGAEVGPRSGPVDFEGEDALESEAALLELLLEVFASEPGRPEPGPVLLPAPRMPLPPVPRWPPAPDDGAVRFGADSEPPPGPPEGPPEAPPPMFLPVSFPEVTAMVAISA
jgi:hypothetical protein